MLHTHHYYHFYYRNLTTRNRFKVVDNHPIQVDILLPPGLKEGKHPLIIAYHGGYLIAGARNHYRFMASWLPAYAASTSAIIVSPDHRLLPSATVPDILSDLEDLWEWIHKSLPAVLASQVPQFSVDLDHILVQGSSAGGFNAAHLALSHCADVRAAILVYPMVDCLMDYLANGPPEAKIPNAGPNTSGGLWIGDVLDSKIDLARKSGWATQRISPEGLLLTQSIMKGGRFGHVFGSDKRNNPLDRARDQSETSGLPAKMYVVFLLISCRF